MAGWREEDNKRKEAAEGSGKSGRNKEEEREESGRKERR